MNRWIAVAFAATLALSAGRAALAAERVEEKDVDNDGRKETRVYYDGSGAVTRVTVDQNKDGKPDLTAYYTKGFPDRGERDSDFDGKIDTWIKYEADGNPSAIAIDRYRKDGKKDYWIYLKHGRVVRREWDRNFDGKPDFRILQDGTRLIEKDYDENFDGKYDRVDKAPPKGTAELAPTEPPHKATAQHAQS